MFIKTIFKDSGKVKRIKNYLLKCNLYLYFLIYQNMLISGEKILMSAELKRCVTWLLFFWIFFRHGISVWSFIIVGYVRQTLDKGAFLGPPMREQPRKRPFWIGLNYEPDCDWASAIYANTNVDIILKALWTHFVAVSNLKRKGIFF